MKKKLNPNYHKRLRGEASKSWSDLPFDLLNLVFERLSFADFQRAKSVCSSWRSSSRQCVPKNHIPWVLRFPQNNENSSCMLFNPEEKDKLYKTQDLGLEFAKSSCMKTYGSWLLMQNLQSNLFIVNLFTGERINLPPVESQFGMTKIQSPVFWIDEKTKDHVVSWARSKKCVVYSKTGDNSWNKIPKSSGCLDMVYKDHKLYFSSYSGKVKIFDFSGEIPQQIVIDTTRKSTACRQPSLSVSNRNKLEPMCEEKHIVPPLVILKPIDYSVHWPSIDATNIVVTVTGDVLKVVKVWTYWSRSWSFRLYKVYSLGFKQHEQVYSLGDEAMLLDLGITVLANDNDGIRRNSIYFSDCKNTNKVFHFSFETRKMERLHKFDCSSVQLSSSQWFLPSNSLRHD
ncbi:probable F-box protein At4g22165 [Brassica rapa]|uniref:probable F-box protein At4g22165 n=1 Tax=Brassica campestris TaxID=3711 RepID=UPI00142E44F4|nr:probable F-box protein At4g22165 [Brassica rapa]